MIGSVSLLLFYFLVMGLFSGSWSATISQFRQLWYWMGALAAGFGIQIGLYTELKTQISKIKATTQNSKVIESGKKITTTSGAASSVSMVACCAHHLSEVLPLIGLSAASVFLTRYQVQLILLGIFMNAFGIIYMLQMIKKISC